MSGKIRIKADKLHENKENRRTHTQAMLFPFEEMAGYVFALSVIESRGGEGASIASVIAAHVEMAASRFGHGASPERQFEQFLSGLNKDLANRVLAGEWDMPVTEVNAMVGLASGDETFLSGSGELTALFLRRKPESQRYQIFSLFRSIHAERHLPTWEKPFAVVLDGDLGHGDVLCVSSEDLQRHVPTDELNSILSTLPPKSAAAKIRQYFPHSADVALIILRAEGLDGSNKAEEEYRTMEDFENTAQETDRFLEDQSPNAFAWLKKLPAIFKTIAGVEEKKHSAALEAGRSTKKTKFSIIKTWLLKKIVPILFRFKLQKRLKKWQPLITPLRKEDTTKAPSSHQTDRIKTKLLSTLNRLPSSTKYLGLAAVGVLLILVVSISVMSKSKATEVAVNIQDEKISAFENKRDQAAGAVIYKDEDRARQLYDEALVLLNNLPTETPEQIEQIERFRSEINAGLDELRHIISIPEPPVAADFSTLNKGVTGTALAKLPDGSIIAFGSDKAIYKLDVSGNFSKLEITTGEIGLAKKTTNTETNTILFLDDRPGISSFNNETSATQVTTTSPIAGKKWNDIELYSSKLYALQIANDDGQILRHWPLATGFGVGSPWIQSKTIPLGDAVSLTIDGTIFVLKQDGTIVRFGQGTQLPWTAGPVDPVIQAATDIWTNGESDFIYVLEPAQKRLIVYKKENGEFVTQYRSEQFEMLSDFIIDEAYKNIYLLNGTKIFKISISHL